MREQQFREEAAIFLTNIFQQMERQKIELKKDWQVDHICYRCDSYERYELLKKEFLHFADLLVESDVNGRPISTYRLFQPLSFRGRTIPLVELPAPKKGKVTPLGFEHIEVVCDLPFPELKEYLQGCLFDESALVKELNPELEVVLERCAVKFHHMPLDQVIAIELSQKRS